MVDTAQALAITFAILQAVAFTLFGLATVIFGPMIESSVIVLQAILAGGYDRLVRMIVLSEPRDLFNVLGASIVFVCGVVSLSFAAIKSKLINTGMQGLVGGYMLGDTLLNSLSPVIMKTVGMCEDVGEPSLNSFQLVATYTSVKSDAPSSQKSDEKSNAVKVETEEDKQRKKRAEARAKKLEAMSSLRNSGFVDDDTAVSGISRRHRIRRKKSALAAIIPEDRERNDWKKSVYSSVLNAERVKWQTSVYTHVINAEATRAKNVEAKRELDEQNLASQRRLENKKRLDMMARKFAACAEQFHKIRREGGADDDSSVVSGASKIKRRRGRKSTMRQSLVAPLEEESAGDAEPITDAPTEPAVLTQEEMEKLERKQWCELVYVTALQAEQTQRKTSVYPHIIR
jgi:hypothetical protein